MDPPTPSDESRGLREYDRLFRALKGPDRAPNGAEFTPLEPEKTEAQKRQSRFSVKRVAILFVVLWAACFVLSLIVAALRGL
jgi:hypothetical protein